MLAVAFYPAFSWLAKILGGRPATAAAILTLITLGIVIGPATWLGRERSGRDQGAGAASSAPATSRFSGSGADQELAADRPDALRSLGSGLYQHPRRAARGGAISAAAGRDHAVARGQTPASARSSSWSRCSWPAFLFPHGPQLVAAGPRFPVPDRARTERAFSRACRRDHPRRGARRDRRRDHPGAARRHRLQARRHSERRPARLHRAAAFDRADRRLHRAACP